MGEVGGSTAETSVLRPSVIRATLRRNRESFPGETENTEQGWVREAAEESGRLRRMRGRRKPGP